MKTLNNKVTRAAATLRADTTQQNLIDSARVNNITNLYTATDFSPVHTAMSLTLQASVNVFQQSKLCTLSMLAHGFKTDAIRKEHSSKKYTSTQGKELYRRSQKVMNEVLRIAALGEKDETILAMSKGGLEKFGRISKAEKEKAAREQAVKDDQAALILKNEKAVLKEKKAAKQAIKKAEKKAKVELQAVKDQAAIDLQQANDKAEQTELTLKAEQRADNDKSETVEVNINPVDKLFNSYQSLSNSEKTQFLDLVCEQESIQLVPVEIKVKAVA